MAKRIKAGVLPQPTAPLEVAYHAGPPEIQFSGRRWLIGAAQKVTGREWTTMQVRPDFKQFDFKLEE